MPEKKKSIYVYLNSLTLCGGAQMIMIDVINTFKDVYDFKIITTNEVEKDNFNSNFLCNASCPIVSFGYKRSKYYPEFLNFFWKIPVSIIKYSVLLRKEKPDISLSLLNLENFVNIFSCKFVKNIKTVVSMRTSPISPHHPLHTKIYYNILMHLTQKYADLVIINSNEVKQMLVTNFGIDEHKIKLIYNPKDVSLIQKNMLEKVDEEFFKSDLPIIITVGRLSYEKGQKYLLRIFAEVNKKIPAKLAICGDGPLRKELEEDVKALNISDKVSFLGWCANPHKYIYNSTVFVLPSLHEGLPNSLIEALICCCPSVSADCKTGPREILDGEKYGLLSKDLSGTIHNIHDSLSEAEKDMYNKIISLLSDEKLRKHYHDMCMERAFFYNKEERIMDYLTAFDDLFGKGDSKL